jgi:hypothetical protein
MVTTIQWVTSVVDNDGTMYVGGRKTNWQAWLNFDDVHTCYNGDCDIISFHWLSL